MELTVVLSLLDLSGISRALIHLAFVGTIFVSGCAREAGAVVTEPREVDRTSSVPTPGSDVRTFRYRLQPAPLTEIPKAGRGEAPLRLLASGSRNARIVDPDGSVIRSAEPGGTIFSFAWSPNRRWVLLYFGGAKYAVALATSLEDIVRPPLHPEDHDDATGFSWLILDEDRLIGYAELPSLESTEGLTASEADGLPPRGTLVFIYTIATGIMTPVEIDDSVPRPFSISYDSYGNLNIVPHSGLEVLGMEVLRIPDP